MKDSIDISKAQMLKINSLELHLITGMDIKECRRIFKDNYLPARTTFDMLMTMEDNMPDLYKQYKHFREYWYQYRENREYVLHHPFVLDPETKLPTGEFKIGPKIRFIIEHVKQTEEIIDKWEQTKQELRRQMSIV